MRSTNDAGQLVLIHRYVLPPRCTQDTALAGAVQSDFFCVGAESNLQVDLGKYQNLLINTMRLPIWSRDVHDGGRMRMGFVSRIRV